MSLEENPQNQQNIELLNLNIVKELKSKLLANQITLIRFNNLNVITALSQLASSGQVSLEYNQNQEIIGYEICEPNNTEISSGQPLTKDEFYRMIEKDSADLDSPELFTTRFSIGTYHDIAGRNAVSCQLINFSDNPLVLISFTFLTKDDDYKIKKMEQRFVIYSYDKHNQYLPAGVKLSFYQNGQKLEGFEAVLEPNENYLSCRVLPEFELMQGKRFIESIELFEIRVESGSEYTSFSSHDIFDHQKDHLNTQRDDEKNGLLEQLKRKLSDFLKGD